MNKQDQMTMQEAERKMESLREVFQVVRLVDGEMLMDREKRINAGDLSETCQCYSFWKKDKECENCSSLLALKEQTQKIKFEFLDLQVFQVISRYVEIDGRPYVMEMIQNLDESIQIDQEGYDKLISKLSGYNEKLYTDVMTGIYNRRFFEEKIKNMEDEAGIAVIDLDDFKLHNDTYGHSAGDAALITTANIIKKYIRKTDILIRYGGDEFLLILPSIKKHIFEDKLKLIQEKIHDAVVPNYEKMQLSVSIGGAIFREGNIEDAVASADRQMYIAKNYKNMVVTEWDENGKKKEENSASEKLKQQILIVDDSEIKFNDGTHKIFLNTKGNRDGISEELQMLLDYFDGREPESQLAKDIDRKVFEARNNKQWRREYMSYQMELDRQYRNGREEGIKEGMEKGSELATENINKLLKILIVEKKYDEIEKISENKEYQKELMKKYNIIED